MRIIAVLVLSLVVFGYGCEMAKKGETNMFPMILELNGTVESDTQAVELAKVWSATGVAIAQVAKCKSIRTKIFTHKIGREYSVSVKLFADVISSDLACDLAAEWKALDNTNAEVSVYTGTPE